MNPANAALRWRNFLETVGRRLSGVAEHGSVHGAGRGRYAQVAQQPATREDFGGRPHLDRRAPRAAVALPTFNDREVVIRGSIERRHFGLAAQETADSISTTPQITCFFDSPPSF